MATDPAVEADKLPVASDSNGVKLKLHGRAFYESIGSPKVVLAPMVDQSEFVRTLATTPNITDLIIPRHGAC